MNAALILVKLVGEYLNCLSLIPSLSTDILSKMVELLRCFIHTHTPKVVLLLTRLAIVQPFQLANVRSGPGCGSNASGGPQVYYGQAFRCVHPSHTDRHALTLGLKALAAESVGVAVALIPHIKARIGHYLAQKKHVMLNDLDRILGVSFQFPPL